MRENDATVAPGVSGRSLRERAQLSSLSRVGRSLPKSDAVRCDRTLHKHVAVVRFRFAERNTFNLARVTALIDAAEAAAEDRQVRALLFVSDNAGFFSDGYSIAEMLGPEMRIRLRAGDFGAYYEVLEVYRRLIRIPIPTVSFVDGICQGAGLEWALCCDFVFAHPRSSFAFHEIRLGLVPGLGGLEMLAMRVPGTFPARMVMTAAHQDAKAAREVGLVDSFADDSARAAGQFAADVAVRPRNGLMRIKALSGVIERKLGALESSRAAFEAALLERVRRES